jgi:MYXO-CTERM domain-containing protein
VAQCVPPPDEEDEDDGGSLFERDGFVNGGEGSGDDAQEGCAVGHVGGGRGASWGLGALVVGALALLRRRR